MIFQHLHFSQYKHFLHSVAWQAMLGCSLDTTVLHCPHNCCLSTCFFFSYCCFFFHNTKKGKTLWNIREKSIVHSQVGKSAILGMKKFSLRCLNSSWSSKKAATRSEVVGQPSEAAAFSTVSLTVKPEICSIAASRSACTLAHTLTWIHSIMIECWATLTFSSISKWLHSILNSAASPALFNVFLSIGTHYKLDVAKWGILRRALAFFFSSVLKSWCDWQWYLSWRQSKRAFVFFTFGAVDKVFSKQ